MIEKVLQFWSSKPYWTKGSMIFGIVYILSVFLLWVFTQDIELAIGISSFPFILITFVFFLIIKLPAADSGPWFPVYLFFFAALIGWLIVGAIVGQAVKMLKSGRKYTALSIFLVIPLVALFFYYIFTR